MLVYTVGATAELNCSVYGRNISEKFRCFYYLYIYFFSKVLLYVGSYPLRSFPGIIWNWPLYSEGRERPKKEGVHSRLAGGSFNKQKEFTHEASLGWQQDEWILAPTCKILKVYKEVLTEFNHIYPVGFPNTTKLSQGNVLGRANGTHSPRTGER